MIYNAKSEDSLSNIVVSKADDHSTVVFKNLLTVFLSTFPLFFI